MGFCVYKSSWMLADTQKYMYTEQLHYVNVCAFVKKKGLMYHLLLIRNKIQISLLGCMNPPLILVLVCQCTSIIRESQ